MAENLKVLVVDDSAIYRSLVQGCLREIEGVDCVGAAHDGRDAIAKAAELAPDVVLLDVEMPVMNGLQAIPKLRELDPAPGIIMVSSLTTQGADITMEALQSGAFDFVPKPQVKAGEDGFGALRDPLERALAAFCESKSSTRGASAHQPEAKPGKLPVVDAVVLGVSTGGPSALSELVPAFPAEFPVPILVVQHMPARFTASLADSLDRKSKLRVREASAGEQLEPGMLLIAPGGQHMHVGGRNAEPHVRFSDGEPVNSFRPSVDVLFDSAAEVYGENLLALILTGMGSDGLEGVRKIRNQGGYCLAQDRASCAVYGMPRSVAEAGQADEVLSLDAMASRIMEIVQKR